MTSLQRNALLIELIDQMREMGSWCGETHVQKGVYLLEDLAGVETGLDFVLYKHGPFSFELRDELTAMRSDELIDLRVQPQPYGPKLVTTEQAEILKSKFPKTLSKFAEQLSFVSNVVKDRGVSDLEKLATAVFISFRDHLNDSIEVQARCLHDIKPHISFSSAFAAIQEAKELRQKSIDDGLIDV